MRKEISITPEESRNVECLFMKYNSYMSMLEYFAESAAMKNSEIYDKKWNEAAEIWIELDNAKRAVEKKYKPSGNWAGYEFDFDNDKVIFYENT